MTTQPFRFIYFAQAINGQGPIKIGCSRVPARRIEALMAWSPQPLHLLAVVPGNWKLENNLHQCFADAHLHHEWFNPIPRLVDAVRAIASGVPIAEAVDLSKRVGSIRGAPHSDERRRRMGYSQRFSWLSRKYRGKHLPHDVDAILRNWSKDAQPTEAEFARLHEILNAPTQHLLTSEQKYPPKRVAA